MGNNASTTSTEPGVASGVTIDRFDPLTVATFRYVSASVDYGNAEADPVGVRFSYALNDAAGNEVVTCHETFTFPRPDTEITPTRREAFERFVLHLGLAAGLSYYKLAAPPRVEISDAYAPEGFSIGEIAFHRRLLAKGLGEFSFVNGLDAELQPEFSYRSAVRREPVRNLIPHKGPLVPVGGGKDSCVSIEILRSAATYDARFSPTLITVNRYPVISDVIRDASLPDIAVVRTLDAKLGVLNSLGALNGHVPATAIVSLAVICAAVLHGHGAVVMSNERSASEGNVEYQGIEINHQWSKSGEAEEAIAALVRSIAPELAYFSLLRPLSELSIARRFAATCGRYFDSFSSCNAAFRLDPARRTTRWCGHCPKCQFVYLALATALDREVLEGIWGSELFESSEEDGFAALLGLRDWKPFECVGEYGECRVALQMVMENPQWAAHPVLDRLKSQLHAVSGWSTTADRERVFAESTSFVPADFLKILQGAKATP